MPLERDEGEYAYMAQQMLNGVPPYISGYSMKFPGIYTAYAVIMTLFGQTIEGIRLGLIFVNAANIALLFFLARRLIGAYAGAIAAVFFALSSLDPNFLGLTANAEHFVLLPALAGSLVLLRALDSRKPGLHFISGLCFGLALIVKQHGVFFGVFAFLFMLWHAHKVEKALYADIAKRSALFASGAAMPLLTTCVLLYASGAFDKFWFWTVTYGAGYVNCLPLGVGLNMLSRQIRDAALSPAAPLYCSAIAGIVLFFSRRPERSAAVFAAGFLGASFLSVAQGFYFRGHYFIFILPILSIFAGAAFGAIRDLLSKKGRAPMPALLPSLLAAAVCSFYLSGDSAVFFYKGPAEVSRFIYGASPFPEAVAIADHIRSVGGKSYTMAVLGSEPEMYFYLDGVCPTGYIYMYPLLEPHERFSAMQKEMVEGVMAASPDYVVYFNAKTSWHEYEQFIGTEKRLFEWIHGYLPANYDVIGIVDVIGGRPTGYRWGGPLVGYEPEYDCYIIVFRKKPPESR